MAVYSDERIDLKRLSDYEGYHIIDEYGGYKLIKTTSPNRYMAVKDNQGEILRQRSFTTIQEAVKHWRSYCIRYARQDPLAVEELQHRKVYGYYL